MKPIRVLFVLSTLIVCAASAAVAQSNWIGPYDGNWSDPANWSAGLPQSADSVQIASGGNDSVVLDIGANMTTLTLGSTQNGTTSTLYDNGVPQSLTVSQWLEVGETGVLNLQGYGGSVTTGSILSNAGTILLNNGVTLTVNSDLWNTGVPAGTLDISGGSTANINGDVLNYAALTTGFYGSGGNSLNIGGTLTNYGQFSVTGAGDVANVGDLVNNSTLSVGAGETLNVANQLNVTDIPSYINYLISGTFTAGLTNPFASLTSIEGDLYLANGQTTNIAPIGGTLVDSGVLNIDGASTVNIAGGIANRNSLVINRGATLNLTTPLNVTDIPGLTGYQIYGTFNAGPNNAFANLTSIEGILVLGNNQTTDITPNGGTLGITQSFAQFADLEIGGDATVNIHGSVQNTNGQVIVGGLPSTLNVSGTFNNGGLLFVARSGVANLDGLVNTASVFVAPGGTLNLTNQPGGIIDVLPGSTYRIQGDFIDVVNQDSAFAQLTNIYGAVTIDNGQIIQDNPIGGTLTIANGASLTVLNGSQFFVHSNIVGQTGVNIYLDPAALVADGTFYNNGANVTIDGNSVFTVGGISNGGPLLLTNNASVTVRNGFYQLASGTLGEAIDATGFSIITVNGGPVVLDGTLDVLLDPNFNPTVGSFYRFLLFGPGSLSGTFASLQNGLFNNGTEKWVVIYNNAGGYVELMAQSNASTTPEPASFLLLGTGLLGLSYRMRRRVTLQASSARARITRPNHPAPRPLFRLGDSVQDRRGWKRPQIPGEPTEWVVQAITSYTGRQTCGGVPVAEWDSTA